MGENNFWADRRTRIGTETAGELAKKYNRQNYRLHPEAQQAAVEGSLDELGFIDAVSVSEKVDKLFDGHLRVELALLRFGEDFKLPVDYYDLDEAETAKALIYRDMTAQMAEINIPALQELRFEMPEFDNPSFDEFLTTEFDFDFGGGNGTEGDTPPQIDKAAELQKKWQVEPGQLWGLGEHRLICGDCTDAAVVERVMEGKRAEMINTDPVYGVNYSGQSATMYYGKNTTINNRTREKLLSDNTIEDAIKITNKAMGLVISPILFLWCAPQYHDIAKNIISKNGYHLFSLIVWNKNHANFGAMGARYKPKYEMALACSIDKIPWFGPDNETTVWDIDRASKNEYHPTQKPVELFERAIRNHTELKSIVYDPFLGSGTTLIACQNLNRRCRAIEIEPKYVAVTLQRFLDHTGIQPQLIE